MRREGRRERRSDERYESEARSPVWRTCHNIYKLIRSKNDRQGHSHLVNIGLLLSEAEFPLTFIFDVDEQFVLKEGIDDDMFERRACRIIII